MLSVNGNVICVSNALAGRLRNAGYRFDFSDARAAGLALTGEGKRLRIGVPFPFSMHAERVYYRLGALGLSVPQDREVRTVPPPLMAQAMAAGEIDLYRVGEPWGSMAVEQGVGELLLPGAAIWAFAPEKVQAVRQGRAEAEPDRTGRLMRAVLRAGRWLGDAGNRVTASEILARPEHVNVPAELLDRALPGRMVISPDGQERQVPGFMEFHAGAASFPWRSQAAWIGARLARRFGLPVTAAVTNAQQLFRGDLYRLHLATVGADLPGASAKLEGSLSDPTPVTSAQGRLILPRNRFFDGRIFDPSFAG